MHYFGIVLIPGVSNILDELHAVLTPHRHVQDTEIGLWTSWRIGGAFVDDFPRDCGSCVEYAQRIKLRDTPPHALFTAEEFFANEVWDSDAKEAAEVKVAWIAFVQAKLAGFGGLAVIVDYKD